jgi:hypothetical protein
MKVAKLKGPESAPFEKKNFSSGDLNVYVFLL